MHLLGSKRIRTMAYHPIANGLVERFHCQLKVALKCHNSPNQWTELLPLVLLSIRIAKRWLAVHNCRISLWHNVAAAWWVFRVFAGHKQKGYNWLCFSSQNYNAGASSSACTFTAAIEGACYQGPGRLHSCICQTWRSKKRRRPVQNPYDGPYKILKLGGKYFTMEFRGRSNTVSIDWLKPAHLDHASCILPSM